MDASNTVLVVGGDGHAWAVFVEALLTTHGYRAMRARTCAEASAMLGGIHVDLVVIEHLASGLDGCEFLAGLRTTHPDVIRVLAFNGVEPPEDLARAAVYQFLHLPLDPEQAGLVVKRGLEARELSRRHRLLSREFKLSDTAPSDAKVDASADGPRIMRFEKLVYVSEKMAEVCHQARIAARTDLPVLIQGETGTGKELLAHAIHYNSLRRTSPLLVQNCSGISDIALQSELFGHRRGAFAGAVADRVGLLRSGDGGTVFLDDISEVSPAVQIQLLRYLQDGEYKPIGADHTVSCNVRIIAASSRGLKAMTDRGEFRRDLYYRLKGFEFEILPLRERTADIVALAEFFAARQGEDSGRRILGISARAIEKLSSYHWPGNIRELESELCRLVALTGDGEYITTQHMSAALVATGRQPALGLPWSGHGKTLKDQVESLERQLVHATLERCRWNQSKAAGELGLSRVGLANKIRRYGLAEA